MPELSPKLARNRQRANACWFQHLVQMACDLGQHEDPLTFTTREFVLSTRYLFCMSVRWRDSYTTERWAHSVLIAQEWIAPMDCAGTTWKVT